MKYRYNMTPIEILLYTRLGKLEFGTPKELGEAFDKVGEHWFGIGYDTSLEDEKAERKMDEHRVGLGNDMRVRSFMYKKGSSCIRQYTLILDDMSIAEMNTIVELFEYLDERLDLDDPTRSIVSLILDEIG